MLSSRKDAAMSRSDSLPQWIATVSTQMPHLSRPHVRVLALWSYGMVLAQSCGLTTVAAFLGAVLETSPQTLRQQLREWCYAATDKKGRCRQEVPVTPCFGALVRSRAGMVARTGTAAGPGYGCHDAGATLYRAGDQRGLSRLRHSGRLDGRRDHGERGVAPALGATLRPAWPQRAG